MFGVLFLMICYRVNALKSIRKIFAIQLRGLRGSETQSEFSERLGIPLRTLQNLEKGAIPQEKILAQICEKTGISEGRLFLDSDLIPPTAQDLLKMVESRDARISELEAGHGSPTRQSIITALAALDESQLTEVIRVLSARFTVFRETLQKVQGGETGRRNTS